MVLRLAYRGFSMLLCADAGALFEAAFWANRYRASLAAQVIKIGHHGSSGASSSRFLEAVGSRLAIVSVGRNGYGHPSPAAMRRIIDAGAEVRQTDRCGAVSVRIAPGVAGRAAIPKPGYTARDMRGVWTRTPLFRKLRM